MAERSHPSGLASEGPFCTECREWSEQVEAAGEKRALPLKADLSPEEPWHRAGLDAGLLEGRTPAGAWSQVQPVRFNPVASPLGRCVWGR